MAPGPYVVTTWLERMRPSGGGMRPAWLPYCLVTMPSAYTP